MIMRDTNLLHQVLRFLTTVGLPVIAAIVEGVQPWLIYATLGAILAFVGDEGGTPAAALWLHGDRACRTGCGSCGGNSHRLATNHVFDYHFCAGNFLWSSRRWARPSPVTVALYGLRLGDGQCGDAAR